jgi:ATP-dependent Lon protease
MIQLQAFSPGPSFETLRMFANNFTVQGVKIKACKPVLNRLYYLLCQLEDGELERCPFLAKKDEVYVVDMSFIPEKYRLDTARAEKILNQVLNKWLSALESRLAKADLSA